MMKLIQNKDLLSSMNKYMFNSANMKKMHCAMPMPMPMPIATDAPTKPITIAPPITTIAPPTPKKPNLAKPFTPFQKDKLFWCFYIILNGYEEYEINHSSSFSIEKQLKIETVEKLKSIKGKLKDLKLKRTELEDELVNKPTITIKGLYALCLVHEVSITYVYGRKYCELSGANDAVPCAGVPCVSGPIKRGIIIQNEKKEDSIKWTTSELNASNDFLTQIQQEYWHIENIQKPLNAPSAYTLAELQDICQKLLIETHTQTENGKTKAKTKTKLYEEILECL